MHWTASELLLTLNGQKCSVLRTCPWGPNFGPFYSTTFSVFKISRFLYFPMIIMLKGQKVRFALQPAVPEVQAILRQAHWKTPNWPWTLPGQSRQIYVLLMPHNPTSPFCSRDSSFGVTGHFLDQCTQNDLEHYMIKYTPCMCYCCPWIPNFSPFHSMTSHSGVAGHFGTSAPNDPKMSLNTTRLKYHTCLYMCY